MTENAGERPVPARRGQLNPERPESSGISRKDEWEEGEDDNTDEDLKDIPSLDDLGKENAGRDSDPEQPASPDEDDIDIAHPLTQSQKDNATELNIVHVERNNMADPSFVIVQERPRRYPFVSTPNEEFIINHLKRNTSVPREIIDNISMNSYNKPEEYLLGSAHMAMFCNMWYTAEGSFDLSKKIDEQNKLITSMGLTSQENRNYINSLEAKLESMTKGINSLTSNMEKLLRVDKGPVTKETLAKAISKTQEIPAAEPYERDRRPTGNIKEKGSSSEAETDTLSEEDSSRSESLVSIAHRINSEMSITSIVNTLVQMGMTPKYAQFIGNNWAKSYKVSLPQKFNVCRNNEEVRKEIMRISGVIKNHLGKTPK